MIKFAIKAKNITIYYSYFLPYIYEPDEMTCLFFSLESKQRRNVSFPLILFFSSPPLNRGIEMPKRPLRKGPLLAQSEKPLHCHDLY